MPEQQFKVHEIVILNYLLSHEHVLLNFGSKSQLLSSHLFSFNQLRMCILYSRMLWTGLKHCLHDVIPSLL